MLAQLPRQDEGGVVEADGSDTKGSRNKVEANNRNRPRILLPKTLYANESLPGEYGGNTRIWDQGPIQ